MGLIDFPPYDVKKETDNMILPQNPFYNMVIIR